MPELPQFVLEIPPAAGVVVALVLLSLLIQKEMRRALGRPEPLRRAGDPALARRWSTVENWLIVLLFGLFALVVLARLLSFAA